jgi:hypothetical protein
VSDPLSLPLARLDRPLKLHSRALDADLWLVPPGCNDRTFDAPVYTCDECRILLALDLSPAELKAAHLTKALFEGDLLLVDELDSLRRLYERLLRRFRELEKNLGSGSSGENEGKLLQVARHLSLLLTHVEALETTPRERP